MTLELVRALLRRYEGLYLLGGLWPTLVIESLLEVYTGPQKDFLTKRLVVVKNLRRPQWIWPNAQVRELLSEP